MICVPDLIEPIDGWGWAIHWDCGPSELTVLDPVEAMRTHVCPLSELQVIPPVCLRLAEPAELKDRTQGHASAGSPIDPCISTGGTSRLNRLNGEATR